MNTRDFWSRRRAAVEAEADAETRVQQEEDNAAREAELADQSDAEILAALDLPDPESLGEGDDFKVFLTDQIPARIKTRALRHLWRANPVLACVDGLVDYGEDFTDAATVIEGLQTAYQVGKGMTKHVEEMARQAEQEAQATAQPTVEDGLHGVQEDVVDPASEARSQDGSTDEMTATGAVATGLAQSFDPHEPAVAAGPEQTDPTELSAAAAPRRMRFSFEGAQDRV